jgi:hypothetical protein
MGNSDHGTSYVYTESRLIMKPKVSARTARRRKREQRSPAAHSLLSRRKFDEAPPRDRSCRGSKVNLGNFLNVLKRQATYVQKSSMPD